MTTLIVLDAIGLGAHAAAGIALVAAIDRPLDMCRSLVNTMSNLVGAVWIGRRQRAHARLENFELAIEKADPSSLRSSG